MSECSVNKTTFRGWDAMEMENGLIRLVAVPDIGGRIMAYDLGNVPFIFVDPDLAGQLFSAEENQGDGSLAAWKNYGGDKTWPSPQGWDTDDQWHGPPDPVLDTGKYQAAYGSNEDCAWIEMQSPEDLRTGVQITRRFTIFPGSSRVEVHLSFRNISQRKIRWSIWDVIQLDASRIDAGGHRAYDPDCSVTTRLNPASRFEKGFNVMFGDPNNPQWQVDHSQGIVAARYMWEIGKIGIDSDGGWAAFSNLSNGCAFTEVFKHEPEAEYPDEGVGVECWTVGRGKVANLDYEQTSIYLMEVEVLSPFYRFEPGEVKSFDITWGVCKVAGQVVDARPGGCVTSPFSVQRMDGKLSLTGAFGVYDNGDLIAQTLDARGAVVAAIPLMAVAPGQPVFLSTEVAAGSDIAKVQLLVKTQKAGLDLLLAESEM